jgi:hypothetical protein
MDENLHSPQRRLIELRIELPINQMALRRLKKRRLALRDLIARLERDSDTPEPA